MKAYIQWKWKKRWWPYPWRLFNHQNSSSTSHNVNNQEKDDGQGNILATSKIVAFIHRFCTMFSVHQKNSQNQEDVEHGSKSKERFRFLQRIPTSRIKLGEKSLSLFYWMIQLAAFSKLIPFEIKKSSKNGQNSKFRKKDTVNTSNKSQNHNHTTDNDRSGGQDEESSIGVCSEEEEEGNEPKFLKFQKPWQNLLYYLLTIIFYCLNAYKWHFFMAPLLRSMLWPEIQVNSSPEHQNSYRRHLTVDFFFSGHAIYVVASAFATILKTTLLFSSDDLILILNDVERLQQNSKADNQRKIKLVVAAAAADAATAQSNNSSNSFCSSVKLSMIHEDRKRSAWYFSIEGIVAILGAFQASYTAHIVISIISYFEFRLKVYRGRALDFIQVFQLLAQVVCTFIDLTLCIVSVYFLIVIIITLKIQLNDFEKHALYHDALQTQKRAQYQMSCGQPSKSRLEQYLIYYRHLQLVNVYSNGYLRRIYFPCYCVTMTFGLLIFTYVSLNSYEYLPLIVYWFFPALSLFVLVVLIIVALSQVANIYRLSNQVRGRLLAHRGFSKDFQHRHVPAVPSTSDDNRGSSIVISNQETVAVSFMQIVQKHAPTFLNQGQGQGRGRHSELAYLDRCLMTVRPFGFYFGDLGLINIGTPALMIYSACNYLLVILS